MPLPPDDHVIVHGYPEQAAGFDDLLRDLDIGAARLGAAGGMVVQRPT